jgi:uncharacterized protein YfkK (UPF0435 family)
MIEIKDNSVKNKSTTSDSEDITLESIDEDIDSDDGNNKEGPLLDMPETITPEWAQARVFAIMLMLENGYSIPDICRITGDDEEMIKEIRDSMVDGGLIDPKKSKDAPKNMQKQLSKLRKRISNLSCSMHANFHNQNENFDTINGKLDVIDGKLDHYIASNHNMILQIKEWIESCVNNKEEEKKNVEPCCCSGVTESRDNTLASLCICTSVSVIAAIVAVAASLRRK